MRAGETLVDLMGSSTEAKRGRTLAPNTLAVISIHQHHPELNAVGIAQQVNTEPNSISAEIGRIRQFVAGQMGNVRQLLKADVQKAKVLLKSHVSGIRMVPQVERKKGHYIAEGQWNLLGGYGEKSSNPGAKHVRMVAGEGFEPSTFGL